MAAKISVAYHGESIIMKAKIIMTWHQAKKNISKQKKNNEIISINVKSNIKAIMAGEVAASASAKWQRMKENGMKYQKKSMASKAHGNQSKKKQHIGISAAAAYGENNENGEILIDSNEKAKMTKMKEKKKK